MFDLDAYVELFQVIAVEIPTGGSTTGVEFGPSGQTAFAVMVNDVVGRHLHDGDPF